jgi:hypothetical protein
MSAPMSQNKISERKPPKPKRFYGHPPVIVLFWAVLVLIVVIGWRLHVDNHIVYALVILWGLGTQIFSVAFAALVSFLGATPLVGPFVVKIITLPLFLLINGLAFIASMVGLKMGHKRTVFEARLAATILMIGILIGYIIGKVF